MSTDKTEYERGYEAGYRAALQNQLENVDKDTQELILGAARLLTKGVCTRSESDPLSQLSARLRRGAEAELQCFELEAAHKVIVAELRRG